MTERMSVTVTAPGDLEGVEVVLVVDDPERADWTAEAEGTERTRRFIGGEVEVATELRGALATVHRAPDGGLVFRGRTAFSVGA